jgi:hypothetical protein
MVAGSSLSLVSWLKSMPSLLVFAAVAPRLLSFIALACTDVASGQVESTKTPISSARDDDEVRTVAIPRAVRFSVFALTSVYGEAFNDITTDLVVRNALSAGDSTLQLAYNGSVILSMFCGYFTETLAAGDANRTFSVLWGLCQLVRSLGITYLTSDNWLLMVGFVFFDKLTGPLGSAAMDAALLALIRQDNGGSGPKSWIRVPANAMWTMRYPAELLQRTSCQMLLLRIGSVPWWVSMLFTSTSMLFVVLTLRPGLAGKHEKSS